MSSSGVNFDVELLRATKEILLVCMEKPNERYNWIQHGKVKSEEFKIAAKEIASALCIAVTGRDVK